MANIIPTTSATGSAPLMLNEHTGNAQSGGAATIGTIGSTDDKGQGGLDVQASDVATAFQVSDGTGGQNGRRYTGGLANTDLANAVIGLHITANAYNRLDIDVVANDGMQLHLITGTGFTNYRSWTVRGNDSSIGNTLGYAVYVIDPTVNGTQRDTGAYNRQRVDQIGITIKTTGGYSANYAWFFINKSFRVFKTKAGACGIFGASPSFQDYHNNSVTEAYTLFSVSPNIFQIVCPFKIGNGSTRTIFTDNGSTLFTPSGQANGGNDHIHVQTDSYPFYLDLTPSDVITLNGTVFIWGEASRFDFNVSTEAVVILNNVSFTGMGELAFGSSVSGTATFSPASDQGVVIDGANLDGSTFNCDVELRTATNLSNMTINGDLRVNIQGDAVLDFANVTVTGLVCNSAIRTLTINASNGSSLTAERSGTGNIETNIVTRATLSVVVTDEVTALPIENARVHVVAATGGLLPVDTLIIDAALTNALGEVSGSIPAHNQPFKGLVTRSAEPNLYVPKPIMGMIGTADLTLNVGLVSDK